MLWDAVLAVMTNVCRFINVFYQVQTFTVGAKNADYVPATEGS